MDARTEEEKQKISWTHALRKIVINCYKYHGREDLLPAFSEEDEKANAIATANANVSIKIFCYLFSKISWYIFRHNLLISELKTKYSLGHV
jgi:hypothetical protein